MPDRKPMLSADELAFVKGNQPAAEPAVETAPAVVRSLPQKVAKAPTTRFTVDMDVALHKELKKAAVDADLSMSELVRHIVETWLEGSAPKG